MFTVGTTGGIGSGKSTVAKVFEVLGIPVFYADEESKRLLAGDPAVKRAVIAAFGTSIYPDGELDRKALAEIVFKRGNEEKLARLNAIAHPAVRTAFGAWMQTRIAPYVMVEAALLVDTGWYRSLDHLVVVSAPEHERIARVMRRDGVTEAEVRSRIAQQIPDEQRLAAAHTVIRNDGEVMVLPQVLALHDILLGLAAKTRR